MSSINGGILCAAGSHQKFKMSTLQVKAGSALHTVAADKLSLNGHPAVKTQSS